MQSETIVKHEVEVDKPKECGLLAYGTLQFPQIQELVLGRKLGMPTPMSIAGYTFEQIEIEGLYYFAAVERPGSTIYGNIFKINEDDLKTLDDFETKAYTRVELMRSSPDLLPVYIYLKS